MNQKRKQLSALLLAALMTAALCACGGGKEPPAPESSGSVQTVSSGSASVPAPAGSSEEPEEESKLVMDFAGDINLDDEWHVMKALRERGARDISQAIDPLLIQDMRAADLCCINNEFAYSDRGSPMKGKTSTFRAKPENVSVLKDLGADVVTLANNHVFDYGEDAFLDTLDTLKGAGVEYVGAGRNLSEAMSPVYCKLDGLNVAIVNATRAEKNIMTPEAEEESPGVLRCYETERFEKVIREADSRADVVVCCVHWGTEYSQKLEWAQRSSAKKYIEAGADVIVGTHAHCLQGIEYYNGVPVFYNLGNYWFNEKELETCLLELTVSGTQGNWSLSARIIPALQKNCKTTALSGAEGQKVFQTMERISINAGIRPDGTVYEKES